MEFIVGIGQMAVSRTNNDRMRTFALASCLGVVMYAPEIQTLAMAHMLLPSSRNHEAEALVKPAQYVDTGIDALVNVFQNRLGVKKQELVVSVFGGAEAGICQHYNVSAQNIEAAITALKKHQLKVDRMETGGIFARTITGYSCDGHVEVTCVPMMMKLPGRQLRA
ncbi:chemotaxis protein CheD [Anoxynatronum sibiricum]|uniref:Chemotaxis protein CheD n=1 Tax=Anoxynatronum sibiricum TaxID=210623 RepID=A0ABU9VRR0_9CLOT